MKVNKATLKSIAKTFGLTVKFENHGDKFAGCYSRYNKTITINTYFYNKDTSYNLSVFFHEVAHQYCNDVGMWSNFYKPNRHNKTLKRIALKAEKDTDRVGRELMRLYFPEFKYIEWYLSIDKYKWKREWWNNYLKQL